MSRGLADVFGCHFELLEMDLLKWHRDRVSADEVQRKLAQFQREFRVSAECDAGRACPGGRAPPARWTA